MSNTTVMLGAPSKDTSLGSGEATVKETPQETSGTGSVAPESEQTSEQVNAGGEQSSSQDGSGESNGNSRKRGNSPFSQVRELKAKLREQEQSINSRIQELNARWEEKLNSLNNRGNQDEDPSGAFWKSPAEYLKKQNEALKRELLQELSKSRAQNDEENRLGQEMSEAVKFIKSTKGITEDDIQDIRDLLADRPGISALSPMEQAEFALHLWQKQKGIVDKSNLKARASTVVGSTASAGGPQVWTDVQVQAKLDSFPKDMKSWTKEQHREFDVFTREVQDARREGRMK